MPKRKAKQNGPGKGKKTARQRDEKGRFLPGGKPGPGRGKKAQAPSEPLDLARVYDDAVRALRATIFKPDATPAQVAGAAKELIKLAGLPEPVSQDIPEPLKAYLMGFGGPNYDCDVLGAGKVVPCPLCGRDIETRKGGENL